MSEAVSVIRLIVIGGRVQGVGYRAWTEDIALKRGLEGFVRNRADGTVEAAFAGPKGAVEATIEACRQGPPGARVTSLHVSEAGTDLLLLRRRGARFAVLPTE